VGVEKVCSGPFRIRSGVDWRMYFNVVVMSPGPYRGVLELKKGNRPYTLQRFHVYGKIVAEAVNPPPLVGYVDWAGVVYLGKAGNEVLLGKQVCGASRCEVYVDKYLDVATEWRGLGVQALRVEGFTGWWLDVDVYSDNVCFELTWVGQ
jgi:hypothetical protein